MESKHTSDNNLTAFCGIDKYHKCMYIFIQGDRNTLIENDIDYELRVNIIATKPIRSRFLRWDRKPSINHIGYTMDGKCVIIKSVIKKATE